MTDLIINGRFLCQRPTGVQRVSREFVTALDRLLRHGEFDGLQVRLIAPRAADFAALRLTHITTEHLGGGAGHCWEQVALPLRARRTPLLCLGNTGPVIGLIGGRVAVLLHDQSYRLYPEDYSLAYRAAHRVVGHFVIKGARPLITVSRTEAQAIRDGNGGRPATVIIAPNGSWIGDRPAPLPPRSTTEAGKGFVLHVGGFSERKNVDGVFAAAEALAGQGIATLLVGRPNERSETFLSSLDPRSRPLINFTGHVDDDQLAQAYREAACLMYPSFYEASGLPPSEAMTFGCPVVVSDLPVLRERCGSAALYCDPHDHRSIVARVLDVVRDPSRAADLSLRGHDQVRQFTWENQARIIVRTVLQA